MSSIDWPPGFDRTRDAERTANHEYDVSLSQTFTDLETELDRSASTTTATISAPTSGRPTCGPTPDQTPTTPGSSCGGRWTATTLRSRATAPPASGTTSGPFYLNEKRRMEQRPVETGESESATARLPPGDEDDEVIVAGAGRTEPPPEVLDVDPDAPDQVIDAAFRAKVKDVHPDHGGDLDDWMRRRNAREAMLDG